jgi:predicted Zn-dependent protease
MDQHRITELKTRIAQFPDNVLDRFVLSKTYYDAFAWEECAKEAAEILKIQPDYLLVHIHLGESLLNLGKKGEAKEVLQKGRALAIAQRHQGPQEEIEELLAQLT